MESSEIFIQSQWSDLAGWPWLSLSLSLISHSVKSHFETSVCWWEREAGLGALLEEPSALLKRAERSP